MAESLVETKQVGQNSGNVRLKLCIGSDGRVALKVGNITIPTQLGVEEALHDRKKLLGSLTEAIWCFKGDGIDKRELIATVVERIDELLKDFVVERTGNLKLVVSGRQFTPRQLIMIRYEHLRVPNFIIRMRQGDEAIIFPPSPREAEKLITALRSSDFSAMVNWENDNMTTLWALLVRAGIDPQKPITMTVEPTGYLYLYETEDGILVLSRKRLRLGENKLRLRIPTKEELKKILEEELPGSEVYQIARVIERRNLYPISVAKSEKNEDPAITALNYIMYYSTRLFIAEHGLSDDELKRVMRGWSELLEHFRRSFMADQLITDIYLGSALPFFSAETAPHMTLFTRTNAGKTTLYRELVGEDPITDASPRALVGHYDAMRKQMVHGLLHERKKALQIEGFEQGVVKDTCSLLIDYMKSGIVRRTLAVGDNITRGSCPIILTGNTEASPMRVYKLQTFLTHGLFDNPEALGSRLLLFYKDTRRLTIYDTNTFKEATYTIREVADSVKVEQELQKLWLDKTIRAWLTTRDKGDELKGLEALDPETCDANIVKLVHYLVVLKDNYHPRLKALSLNNVLLLRLNDILAGKASPQALIEEAHEPYERLKHELAQSIIRVTHERIRFNPTEIALSLSTYLIRLILLARRILEKRGVTAPSYKPVEIDVNDALQRLYDEVRDIIPLKRDFKRRVKKAILTAHDNLRLIGIQVDPTDPLKICVDTTKFFEIDFTRLENSLG